MSNAVLILGDSGTGKSTSMMNLDPKETFIVNVIGKSLPFRGFKKNYITCGRTAEGVDFGNYQVTDKAAQISSLINYVNNKRPEIKNFIIDDCQYVMSNEYMRRSKETGYGKFTDIGNDAFMIVEKINSCRDDLNFFVMFHSVIDKHGIAKCKTIGNVIDEKMTFEGRFTNVLHAITSDGRYYFLTQHNGIQMAKTPMGMFDEKIIPNDLKYVGEKINSYFNEDITI